MSMKRTSVASRPPATVESWRRESNFNSAPAHELYLINLSLRNGNPCSVSSFGFAHMSFFMHVCVCVAARDSIASFVTRAAAITTFYQ